MEGSSAAFFFQPAPKRARVDAEEPTIFDEAFPLSNGGGGGALRLSNPWLLSQMRRASLSAFVDAQAMSNMMMPAATKISGGGIGGTTSTSTLDGPSDGDEMFKNADNVLFGGMGVGIGLGGIEGDLSQGVGLNVSSARVVSYMDDDDGKDPSLALLAQLQQQQQQQQQQAMANQPFMMLSSTLASAKRSAAAAGLDMHKPSPLQPSTAWATPASSSLDMGLKMEGRAGGPSAPQDLTTTNVKVSADDTPVSVRFRSHQAENWTEKYEVLLDYRLNHGHCLVPNQYAENPSLAEWVKRQRYQYKLKSQGKHSSMSDDRIVALEKLGFVWNSHDAVWEERLKELKQYKNDFGDTNVPSNYEHNAKLAIWVKRQRRQYKFLTENKPSTMTPTRVEKLQEVGFTWSGRKPKKILAKETWEKKISL